VNKVIPKTAHFQKRSEKRYQIVSLHQIDVPKSHNLLYQKAITSAKDIEKYETPSINRRGGGKPSGVLVIKEL